MDTFFSLCLLVLTGVLAWVIGERSERRKQKNRIFDLEFQARTAEANASDFRQQCEKLNREIQVLKNNFDRELLLKKETLLAFQNSFRKTVVAAGAGCLALGLVFGGTVGGLGSMSASEAKHRTRMMDLDIIARVAQIQAEHFQNEFQKLKEEYTQLRNLLDEERAAKTVAATKLEIILDNLVADKWSRRFSLDPSNLKQNWQQPSELESVTAKTAMVPTAVNF